MTKPIVRESLDSNTNSTEAVTSLMSLGQVPPIDSSTTGNGLFLYQPSSNGTFDTSTAVASAATANPELRHSHNKSTLANYTTTSSSNALGHTSSSFLQGSPTSIGSNSSNFAMDATQNLNTFSVNRQDEQFSLSHTIHLPLSQQHQEQTQVHSQEAQSVYHDLHLSQNEARTENQLCSQKSYTQNSSQTQNFYQPIVTPTSTEYFSNSSPNVQLGSSSQRFLTAHNPSSSVSSSVNSIGFPDEVRYNHQTPVSSYDSLYQNLAVSQPQHRISNHHYFSYGFENQVLPLSQSNIQHHQHPMSLSSGLPTSGVYFQAGNSDNTNTYLSYPFSQMQSQQISEDPILEQAKMAVPLHASSWEVNQNFQTVPYKTLTFTSGDTIENAIYTKLWCRNGSNEYSPILKADNKYNSISLNQSKGKPTRIENLLKTGGTNRIFHNFGVQSINNDVSLSGKEILKLCVDTIYSAVGTPDEFQTYCAPNETINRASRKPSRGVASQRPLPSGVDMIMTAQHKTEIKNTFLRWSSQRPKTENFFRMDNKKGLSFSLEELKEGLDILMSRPPRRINNYAARQVLTDVTYGQGRGVTEFNQNIAPLHVPSESTRKVSRLSPAGICPVVGADGQLDIPEQSSYNSIPSKDIPYLNTKKSSQYDPCYCRRQGIQKEGWCGICKKGGWFLMKNSGYLYHQNHEHGIFPGGYIFEDPLVIRRKISREARWEGLCGICYHWIDLDHTERKLWGTWYRHYKLCVNEYEEIKKLLRATCAPVELIEIEYIPPRL
jgi:hypothetical protein